MTVLEHLQVMYLRMAGSEALPVSYAYIEFSNQHSVPVALQNNGIDYGAFHAGPSLDNSSNNSGRSAPRLLRCRFFNYLTNSSIWLLLTILSHSNVVFLKNRAFSGRHN